MFIVFDGIDGCGKTTLASLLKNYLEKKNFKVWLTKEPTSSKVGRLAKEIIEEKCEFTENLGRVLALLFAADRHLHQEEIKKYLDKGYIVISDRYYYSSFAYQLIYPNLTVDWIRTLNQHLIKPDVAFIIDLEPREAVRRIMQRSKEKLNIYEDEKVLDKVRVNFLRLKDILEDNIVYLDGNKTPEDLLKDVIRLLSVF